LDSGHAVQGLGLEALVDHDHGTRYLAPDTDTIETSKHDYYAKVMKTIGNR